MSILPAHTTPDELAAHLGVAERTLRAKAREIGACRELGKKMILLEPDVQALMEAMRPCPSGSTNARTATTTGITEAPLMGDDYVAARARLTAKPLKGSKPNSKQKRGTVISMGRARG